MKADPSPDSRPIALILTVGGSPEPNRISIERLRPDVVWFIVSTSGAGQPGSRSQVEDHEIFYPSQSAQGPNGPGLLHLEACPPKTRILEAPTDDPDRMYMLCAGWLSELASEYPGHRLVADYTGGTKSMTGGLLMAASGRSGVEVQLVLGDRVDIIKARSGAGRLMSVSTDFTLLQRDMQRVDGLVESFEYAAAYAQTAETTSRVSTVRGVSRELQTRLSARRALLEIFMLWDRFQHASAYRKARGAFENGDLAGDVLEALGLLTPLEALSDARAANHPHWNLCADLWLNATRCAQRGRFDDAIARLYRLYEGSIQTQLFTQYGVYSPPQADMVPKSIKCRKRIVPPSRNHQYPSVRLQPGELLELLKHYNPQDPLAKAVGGTRQIAWLDKRHNSILAHGYEELVKSDWDNAAQWVARALRPFWCQQEAPQLPQCFPKRLDV